MATKQELEARVTELEAQLATNALPPDEKVAAIQLELDKALEREASVAEQVDALQKKLSGLASDNDTLSNQVSSLQAQLRVLGDSRLSKLPDDAVVLGGDKHDIVEQGRMLDLVDQWRKRFIQDDDFVLVVKKA